MATLFSLPLDLEPTLQCAPQAALCQSNDPKNSRITRSSHTPACASSPGLQNNAPAACGLVPRKVAAMGLEVFSPSVRQLCQLLHAEATRRPPQYRVWNTSLQAIVDGLGVPRMRRAITGDC